MKSMLKILSKIFRPPAGKAEYFEYLLAEYHKYIGWIALLGGLFNMALLAPDFFVDGGVRTELPVTIFRITYSALLFIFGLTVKIIKQAGLFFCCVTVLESIGMAELLFVMHSYEAPNYLIQCMGMMIIVFAIFLVPNRRANMLIVTVLGEAAFLSYSLHQVRGLPAGTFWAGVVYLLTTLGLCTIYSFSYEKHQFNEYLAKKDLIVFNSTDQLTKAWNRNKLEYEYNRCCEFCRIRSCPFCLAIMDMDAFKAINDECGHIAGDAILIELVSLIQRNLRGGDILTRWGGDEFVFLFPGTPLAETIIILERIRKLIENNHFSEATRVTCSFGVVENKDASDLNSILLVADELMYAAKKSGGNCVVYDAGDQISLFDAETNSTGK